MLDLIILAADGDIEITLRTLLEKRHAALGIRPLRFDKQQADCIRSPLHDAGVLTNGPQILRLDLRFAPGPDGKPSPPREAMLYALRLGGRPHSARIFKELAERVSLRTWERAFSRLRDRLQHWFPLT